MAVHQVHSGSDWVRWPALLDKLDVAVAIADAQGAVTFANKAFERAFDLRRGELLGKPIAKITTQLRDADGHYLTQATLPIARVLRTGEPFRPRELFYKRSDGQTYSWLVSAEPVLADDGSLGAVLLTITDISELKQTMLALEVTEKRFRELAEQSRDLIAYENLEGVFQYVSPASSIILGYEPSEMIGHNSEEFVHPGEVATLRERHSNLDEEFFHYVFRAKRRDGSYRWLDTNCSIVRDSERRPGTFMVICRDITEGRQAAEAIKKSEEELNLAQEIAHLGSFELDCKTEEIRWSHELYRIYRLKPEEFTPGADSLTTLTDPEDGERIRSAMAAARDKHMPYEFEHRIICGDRSRRLGFQRGRYSYDASGNAVRLNGTILDITEQKAAEERAAFLAAHDQLTGLANRLVFSEYVSQVIRGAQKREEQVAVLCVGVDRFKTLNDSLGHAAGDALLKIVAERIQLSLRSGEFACRLGGDAFCLCIEATGVDNILSCVTRVHGALNEPYDLPEQRITITTTIGVSVYPNDALVADDLIVSAEAAMYRAKDAGRNSFQLAKPEFQKAAKDRLTIEQDLRDAVREQQLLLHYQPILDLRTGRIAGCEALLRWNHPTRGLLQPEGFIHEAEETGLIIPIGEWVIQTVCGTLTAWIERYNRDLFVAINLSARQLQDVGLLSHIQRSIGAVKHLARHLEFELVESTVMADPASALRLLEQMKAAGVRVALDDFGTGYSSLAYLKRFPLDTVKIDRTFVRDLETDPSDAAIAESIITLGHSLGLDIVAEGVETAGQLSLLRHLNCDSIQGYYFSKAVPADDFGSMLSSGKCLETGLRN